MPMPKQSSGCVGASTQTGIVPIGHFNLAATLALLGQFDEAKAALQVGLALDRRFRDAANARGDNPTFLAGATEPLRYANGWSARGPTFVS